ncbi:S41 family peptidase [Paucihalobacter sp.]|uniref:S41 family peptidase n=1 Tax=Paucihalobacter sp. TaxID=2850405 RepID=UPI002FE22783
MRLFLLAWLLIISSITVFSQSEVQFCKQLTALNKVVQTSHFKPKLLNDSLSKGVYDLFIEALDVNKTIFINEDIALFKADEYKIDDYINANDCSFISKYATVLRERILHSKSIIESLNNEILDYSGKDTLYFFSKSKTQYFEDDLDIRKYWNKHLRYLIISEAIDKDSIWSSLEKNFSTIEKELKPKIIQKQICLLDELLQKNSGLENTVKELFLNAYTSYQDPNSTFFNEVDKSLYEATVSNNILSFGITTTKNKDGDIVIAHIAQGSAASLNGNFENNDVIKSLTSKKHILETYCVSNDDVAAFINDEKNQTVIFKLKKQNGSIQEVELTKGQLKNEENTVTGFVLQQDTNIGYISIPGFYTDLESPNGLGLANDIAKELYKLSKENIDGLVLDLRFNGGGSMKEAADLSGMFINRGPLSILKYSNGETFTLKDLNRGSLFQKPIAIIINNYSASASEFFAAAMQDYNRAVIIGSPSHGKSSAQVILPLDAQNNLGYVKLTIEAFYRVTGKSHQSIGVIPDINLPSLYDNFKTNELYNKYALLNDSVSVNLKHLPLKNLPLSALQSKSSKRLETHKGFEMVKKMNKAILDNYINPDFNYALTLENLFHYFETYKNEWQEFTNGLSEFQLELVANNSSDTNELLQYNENNRLLNGDILKDISSDIYIEEAYNILQDLINLNAEN